MITREKNKAGFTIVELLIVIVVIGILAAMVIVAFNGIQTRAKNTQRTTAASSWLKTIALYTAQHGAFPSGFSNNHICLGTGYPTDLDGVTTDEDCNGSGNVKHPLAATNNALKEFSSLPSFPADKMETGASIGTVVGISVRSYDTLDPSTPEAKIRYPMLIYYLYGNNADCGVTGVVSQVTGGYSSTANVRYTSNVGAFTHCVVMIPSP